MYYCQYCHILHTINRTLLRNENYDRYDIILNYIIMSFLIEFLNNFFFGVIIMESVLKLVSHGKAYFNSFSNIFDIIIIIITILSFYTENLYSSALYGTNLSSIRSFRVFRIFKLFSHSKGPLINYK